MQIVIFKNEATLYSRRIRRLLQDREVMHIDELRLRLGLAEDVVRSELEALIQQGEVERLRPVDYPKDDWDFFRLCRRANVLRVALDERLGESCRTCQAQAASF